ncbi:MAG: replicative DNA helicase [Planctomycetota bacterium]
MANSPEQMLDRLPPQNLDAEMGVLGSMLLLNDVINVVTPILQKEDFYLNKHQVLYEVITNLYDKQQRVDLLIIKSYLESQNLLETVDGVDYLKEVISSVPGPANAEIYAEAVKEKAVSRHLIVTATDMIKRGYDPSEEATGLLDWAETEIMKVAERTIRNEAQNIEKVLHDLVARIDAMDPGGNMITGVPTGYSKLDELTSGFQPGELIILAARPSMGKSTLGLNILEHVGIREGRACVMFTCEMSQMMVAQALVCSVANIRGNDLRRGFLSGDDHRRMTDACTQLSASPIFIDDTPSIELRELRAKSRRLKLHKNLEMVMVDYLQLMRGPRDAARESRQREIAEISRGLKALARELNIPVVALCQLNRAVEDRQGNRPRMSDLRESGALEQDADVVLLLHRPEYYREDDRPGEADVIIAKQRNGPTGKAALTFVKDQMRFENRSLHDERERP